MEAEKYWYYYTSYLIMLQEFSRVHSFQCPNASHNPKIKCCRAIDTEKEKFSRVGYNFVERWS